MENNNRDETTATSVKELQKLALGSSRMAEWHNEEREENRGIFGISELSATVQNARITSETFRVGQAVRHLMEIDLRPKDIMTLESRTEIWTALNKESGGGVTCTDSSCDGQLEWFMDWTTSAESFTFDSSNRYLNKTAF